MFRLWKINSFNPTQLFSTFYNYSDLVMQKTLWFCSPYFIKPCILFYFSLHCSADLLLKANGIFTNSIDSVYLQWRLRSSSKHKFWITTFAELSLYYSPSRLPRRGCAVLWPDSKMPCQTAVLLRCFSPKAFGELQQYAVLLLNLLVFDWAFLALW